MHTPFRTYELAVQFYKQSRSCRLPAHLKKQFDRAASSISLNLNEGWGRSSQADRRHFFQIAFGSIRECQAIFDLEPQNAKATLLLDAVAASTFKLCKALRC